MRASAALDISAVNPVGRCYSIGGICNGGAGYWKMRLMGSRVTESG